jgi:murein DD-endopeptidase MepM/ murein hydrolase activator NlpD
MQVCSPLKDIELAELEGIIVNPFNPPPPGSDDFHQGTDFGDLDPNSRIALSGRPVQTALAGRVAAVILDRFPYGNAVLIETPLENLPEIWAETLREPTPVANSVTPNLSCPKVELSPREASGRSLYLLYAHLEESPDVLVDGMIDCGVRIGTVGSSGNALNPHLHLELRVGPAGAQFPSMAHYDTTASPEEMAGYCTWRVGGDFKILDPMIIFELD